MQSKTLTFNCQGLSADTHKKAQQAKIMLGSILHSAPIHAGTAHLFSMHTSGAISNQQYYARCPASQSSL
ncbi:hypothetical protein ASR47_1005219 [Janthinobacterium psychrotolerans]|uniref:Uncharacterized protein n=1 Tax=Janthinobacterium psychrotolerans TaxID=1747903 RepID=A0A1A7C0K6_9BURK|nr:hypothetical protein ASR47_1005219 [Janthinobacterium psychrotolerans]